MDASTLVREITPKPYLRQEHYVNGFEERKSSFYRIANIICPGFEIGEHAEIHENMIRYFAGDPDCEYNLSKGLYLYGPIGTGKTLLFKILHALTRAVGSENRFQVFTINDLVDGFATDGHKYFAQSGITPSWTSELKYLCGHASPHILIDDLGQSARSVSYYGSNINVSVDLIQRRYIAFTDHYYLTHISTNLEPAEIRAEYGEFISSRMREMFNIILFPGKDRRK